MALSEMDPTMNSSFSLAPSLVRSLPILAQTVAELYAHLRAHQIFERFALNICAKFNSRQQSNVVQLNVCAESQRNEQN